MTLTAGPDTVDRARPRAPVPPGSAWPGCAGRGASRWPAAAVRFPVSLGAWLPAAPSRDRAAYAVVTIFVVGLPSCA